MPTLSDAASPAPESAGHSLSEEPTGSGPHSAPGEKTIVEVSTETIERSADALFVLWLKIGATLLAFQLFGIVWPVFILIVLSLMLVATFSPMVRRLQRRVKRTSAIAIVVTGMAVGLVALIGLIIPPLLRQSGNLINNFPHYVAQIENSARHLGVPIRVIRNLQSAPPTSNMSAQTLTVLSSFVSGVTGLVTILVLTIYLLIDGQQVATGALGLLPRRMRLPVRRMFGEIRDQVGDYVRGQLITSGLAGLFSYLLLLGLGVDEPLALGFLMAVSDIIPIAGPLIGTIPAVLMAMTQSTTTALIVAAAYVIYHQVESHVLVPRIYGKTMKLAPSIIVISILIGATLQGILGALLALPVAAAVPVIYRYIQEWREQFEDTHEMVLP